MESLLLNVKVSHCDLVTEQQLENETCLVGVNKINWEQQHTRLTVLLNILFFLNLV